MRLITIKYFNRLSALLLLLLNSVYDCVRQKFHSCHNDPIQTQMPQYNIMAVRV